jgi:uncharacterized protein
VIDNLSFNIAQLMKDTVGASRTVDVVADLGRLVPDLEVEATSEGERPVLTGPVRLMHTNQGVLVKGRLTGEAKVSCVRCLAAVTVPIEVELEEVFVPTIDMATGRYAKPEEEDEALWIDEHHILNLTEVLRQNVLLELPVHVLCRDDCSGLCPNCGQNLNEGACDCQPDIDPRWSGLSDLLKN